MVAHVAGAPGGAVGGGKGGDSGGCGCSSECGGTGGSDGGRSEDGGGGVREMVGELVDGDLGGRA